MKPLFLVGFMGSGKTTVGRVVAERLGRRFIDIDHEVVLAEGRTVEAIFREWGEGRFRDAERRALDAVAAGDPATVVATGGGLFLAVAARSRIRDTGISVWLDVPWATARDRLQRGEGRPLWRDHEDPVTRRALFERRRASYALADLRIDAAADGPEVVAQRILASPLIFRAQR